jgi:hypothetical protein
VRRFPFPAHFFRLIATCLRTALRVAPVYADAIFNLALLLQQKNEYAEAADYSGAAILPMTLSGFESSRACASPDQSRLGMVLYYRFVMHESN